MSATVAADGPALVIDARAIRSSGIGRHLREVTARLARGGAFRELLLLGDPAELRRFCADEGLTQGVRILPLSGGMYSLASQLGWLRRALTLPRHAVVWFPHLDAPVVFPGPPSVVTVHDLIYLRVPGAASARKQRALRWALRRITRRARRVVTDAEFTRRDLLAHDAALAGKVEVVPCGVTEGFLARDADDERLPPGVAEPYLLAIANRKRHKNLIAAVEILARQRREDPTLTLVVGGQHFPEWGEVLAHARQLGVAEALVDLPHVSDAQLGALYRHCECLLFPSRFEGFGLPVLEAMASGAPVVGANTSSIPEVAGGAALLFDPDDVAGMSEAVSRVRGDAPLRAELVRRGRAQAATFTWERTAAAMERILLAVASERGR